MGEGLKRVARAGCVLRVSAHGVTVDYVPNTKEAEKTVEQRQRDGWKYIGCTEDNEFLQFRKPTADIETE